MRLKEYIKILEKKYKCNCDLDNWEPEKSTDHSIVCRIHRMAIDPINQKIFNVTKGRLCNMKEKIIDKNYGSIPHLSISKLHQQADKKINSGQEKILTKQARDYKDLIIVTEKLDGSNVGILKTKDGNIEPIIRSGYRAIESRFEQHHYFHTWVWKYIDNFNWLPDGWRICGEWMAYVHGIKYDIRCESPFVAFDIIDDNNKRILYMDFIKLCIFHQIQTVPLLHIGQPISIKNSLKILGNGIYGIPEDDSEGFVYKCEREGHVDFLAKYVRHDKEDGKYMKDGIWNIGFKS